MIYFELVDVTANTATNGCNSPMAPRVGEIIEPIKGDLQEVVDVRHLIISDEFDPNYTTLVLNAYCGPVDDENDSVRG